MDRCGKAYVLCIIMSNTDRVTLLENIGLIVAENLKRLREERKLSLEAVAKSSGVSKSMLGQIERGVTNPTISILWKIANGLKISFTSLMMRPETDVELVRRSAIAPLVEADGTYRNYPVFPFDSSRGFEMYSIELDPGARLDAEPHPAGTQEFITVFPARWPYCSTASAGRLETATPSVSKRIGNTPTPTREIRRAA